MRLALGLALALALRSTGAAAADPSSPLREEELLQRWLANSREVASWRAAVGAARFDVVTARLWPNPELALTGNGLVAGTPPDGQAGVQAQLMEPLPIFGQIERRRAAAEAQVAVAEAELAVRLWERAAELQALMVQHAFADARVVMLERNLSELAGIRNIVERRVQAGAASQYDLLRVVTAEGTSSGALNTARIERDKAQASLLAAIADPTLVGASITREGLRGFRGPQAEAALIDVALQRRPDLALARRGVVAAEAQAARWRREAVPTPSLFIAGYYIHQPFGVQASGGLSLPLPLFDRNQGLIGRARVEAGGQAELAAALETRIRAEVSGSWRARESAREALARFRETLLPAAVELLQRAQVTYQAGKFTITELFDAYQSMWEARLNELDLEHQQASAEVELERAAVLSVQW